jgi:succinate dehydrogenase (ubiquinone) membrane anchor subunit
LMYPNPLFDYTIALVLPLHIHWGINSVIVDYVPRPLVMVSKLVLAVLSLSALGGLVYLTYNDVGVCNAIRMIWAL